MSHARHLLLHGSVLRLHDSPSVIERRRAARAITGRYASPPTVGLGFFGAVAVNLTGLWRVVVDVGFLVLMPLMRLFMCWAVRGAPDPASYALFRGTWAGELVHVRRPRASVNAQARVGRPA